MNSNALFDVYVKGEEDKLGDCEWAATCARLFTRLESLLAAVYVTSSALGRTLCLLALCSCLRTA
jgi:hypothetical protein